MANIKITEGQYNRLFDKPKEIIISESQYNKMFSLITEDRESNSMKKAINVVKSMFPDMDAMQVITAVRNDIPNSRLNNCEYLPGVTRMYLSRQIQNGETISNLNSTLKLLAQGHANEYDNNLNGMSAQDLIERFAGARQEDIENAKLANASRQFTQNDNYKIVKISTPEEAAKYGEYTSWCVTHDASMYDNYTHDGLGIFYFLLKNGFENVYEERGENCPLDEYGLSMVAVSVNMDGSLNTVTCRWNHDNGGNDNIMTDEQVSQLIGQDVYQVLKPRDIKVLNETERFTSFESNGEIKIYDKKLKETLNVDKYGYATFTYGYDSHSYGKVNKMGEVVVKPKYFYIGEFENDGYAIASIYGRTLVNMKGEELYDPGVNGNVESISKANEYGVRMIVKDAGGVNNKYKEYINVNTKQSINTNDYKSLGNFDVDGRFIALGYNGVEYLFNGDLSLAVNPELYDEIDSAGEMYKTRAFKKNKLSGLFDKDMSILLEPKYYHIGDDLNYETRISQPGVRRVVIQTENGKKRGNFDYPTKTITWDDGSVEKVGNMNESISYNPTGSRTKPEVDMTVNTDRYDDSNLAPNNADTRMFGYKAMLNHTTDGSTTIKEKFLILNMVNKMYRKAINYAWYKGKRKIILPTDEECTLNGQLRGVQAGMVKKTRNNILKKVEQCTQTGDFQGLIAWCERRMRDRSLEDEINTNMYNRVNDFKKNPFNKYANMIPRYNVGTVPNTNVKVIALFSMTDFNFSDAIKHGELRPNKNARSVLGFDTKNNIPVTYDGGIPANIENNFSVPEDESGDHFKKNFEYLDKNYTSVTRFIDKSIMYAAYALNKENYSPDFIIAAPSSSKFNEYYATNLSRKLGTAQYVSDFFQRNLINFTSEDGQIITERMRNDGVPENLISEFQRTMENVALGEIADAVASPMRRLIKDNYRELSLISAEHYSRDKVNMDVLTRLILNYSYSVIVKLIQRQQKEEISNISKYLTEVFLSDNKYLYDNDLYLINEFRRRIKFKLGKKYFEQVIMQMYNLVVQYGSQLENGRGYKLKFNKPFKITKLSKDIRGYLTDMYVVADKNFNENHELFTRYANGKFLIIDEDLNSGATLANVIHALQNVMPTQNQNNIMCLTNAYSPSGR